MWNSVYVLVALAALLPGSLCFHGGVPFNSTNLELRMGQAYVYPLNMHPCLGVIVSPYKVLTTSGCVTHSYEPDEVQVSAAYVTGTPQTKHHVLRTYTLDESIRSYRTGRTFPLFTVIVVELQRSEPLYLSPPECYQQPDAGVVAPLASQEDIRDMLSKPFRVGLMFGLSLSGEIRTGPTMITTSSDCYDIVGNLIGVKRSLTDLYHWMTKKKGNMFDNFLCTTPVKKSAKLDYPCGDAGAALRYNDKIVGLLVKTICTGDYDEYFAVYRIVTRTWDFVPQAINLMGDPK